MRARRRRADALHAHVVVPLAASTPVSTAKAWCDLQRCFSCPPLPPTALPPKKVWHTPVSTAPLYNSLRTHFADLFPPLISTPQAWLARPACARTAQYLSQCYKLHSDTLLPPPSHMRPLLAPRGL